MMQRNDPGWRSARVSSARDCRDVRARKGRDLVPVSLYLRSSLAMLEFAVAAEVAWALRSTRYAGRISGACRHRLRAARLGLSLGLRRSRGSSMLGVPMRAALRRWARRWCSMSRAQGSAAGASRSRSPPRSRQPRGCCDRSAARAARPGDVAAAQVRVPAHHSNSGPPVLQERAGDGVAMPPPIEEVILACRKHLGLRQGRHAR